MKNIMRIILYSLLFINYSIISIDFSSVQINGIAQQSNGQLVTANTTTLLDGNNGIMVARYNTNGSLDTTFGTNGIVETTVGSFTLLTGIGIQSTGIIVAGGYGTISGSTEFFAVAYNSDGSLDTSFGTSGIASQLIDAGSAAYALLIQPDDSVVQAGVAVDNNGTPVFALSRLTSAGVSDSTFGSSGVVTTYIGDAAVAQALTIQSSDNFLVAAGWAIVSGAKNFALARYDTSGNLDSIFGTSGIVTTNINGDDQITSVGIDSNGNIVVAGSTLGQLVVARYTSAGALDTTFGTGGIFVLSTSGQFNSLAIQSNDEIVVTGLSGNSFIVARITTGGALDTSFGPDGTGIITSPAIEIMTQANAVFLASNGDIMIGGSAGSGVLLAAFTSAGAYDSTWGAQGLVLAPSASVLQELVVITEIEPQGTNGGTFTAGAWQTRILNKVLAGTLNVSLASNQITLQPGLYRVLVSAPAFGVGAHQARLQNVTTNLPVLYGSSAYSDPTNPTISNSNLSAKIFVPSVYTIEVQHQCQFTATGNGFGIASNFGPENYTSVSIVQEA